MKKTDKLITETLLIGSIILLIFSLVFHTTQAMYIIGMILSGLYMCFVFAHLAFFAPFAGIIVIGVVILESFDVINRIKSKSIITYIALTTPIHLLALAFFYIGLPIIIVMITLNILSVSEAFDILKQIIRAQ